MPSTRYSYNIDLESPNTSHALGILLVRPGSRVLDIGAADGSVARVLVDRGCRVWAVEIDEGAARHAALVCEQVVIEDVEQLDLDARLGGARFDAVLLLDVLEHLRDPLTILKRSAQLLAPGGRIIASLPNVTHGAVRLNLLRGMFTYTDTGLLDRTHLRFFDRQAVDMLFDAAGLEIRECLRVRRELTETEIPIDLGAFPPGVVSEVARDPESTTYQFVIDAVPGEDGRPIRASWSLAEQLQQQLAGLTSRFREVEAYARSLEADRQQHAHVTSKVEELTSELTRRMEELHSRELELRHLQSDLAVKEAFVSDLRQALMQHEEVGLALAGAQAFLRSPSVRLVTAISTRLRRFPRVRAALRRLVPSMFSPASR